MATSKREDDKDERERDEDNHDTAAFNNGGRGQDNEEDDVEGLKGTAIREAGRDFSWKNGQQKTRRLCKN